jgi:FixJ family two-component response regulator
MMEYQYALTEIEKVENCINHSQNAYINKENMKLVRLVNRLTRRDAHVSDEIIKQFISLANQYKPEEKTEKAPLSEIIQLFS